jgi:glycosyltransferase involved in cell wall biosynthesis
MNKLYHVINFSSQNSWVEYLLSPCLEKDYTDSLIIIGSEGSEGSLVSCLRKVSPDIEIMSVNDISSFFRLLLHLRAERKRVKLMLNSHGHSASIFSTLVRIFSGIPFVVSHHQQPNFFHYLFKRKPIQSLLHSLVYFFYCHFATHIFAYSMEVSNKLGSFRVSERKFSLIPLGINLLNFQFIDRSPSCEETMRIVVVSRLSWEKRVDLSILVARELLNLGYFFKLTIVGAGSMESSLRKLVKELSLEETVEFIGITSDIQSIFHSSDLLLHMSQTESYGQVILEALLCGVPVFSTPVGVALDLQSMGDPFLEICRASHPSEIATQLSSFMDSIRNLRSDNQQFLLPQEFYSNHDLSVCRRRFVLTISTVFSKL